jgi:hypothetical protein
VGDEKIENTKRQQKNHSKIFLGEQTKTRREACREEKVTRNNINNIHTFARRPQAQRVAIGRVRAVLSIVGVHVGSHNIDEAKILDVVLVKHSKTIDDTLLQFWWIRTNGLVTLIWPPCWRRA